MKLQERVVCSGSQFHSTVHHVWGRRVAGVWTAGHVLSIIRKQRTIYAGHFLISHRRSSLIQGRPWLISQAFLEASLQIFLTPEHQFHPINDSDSSQADNKD